MIYNFNWDFFIVYMVCIVVNVSIMDSIYSRFIRDQMVSINLITLGVVSGIIAALLWGAMEWRMRRQLSNYK